MPMIFLDLLLVLVGGDLFGLTPSLTPDTRHDVPQMQTEMFVLKSPNWETNFSNEQSYQVYKMLIRSQTQASQCMKHGAKLWRSLWGCHLWTKPWGTNRKILATIRLKKSLFEHQIGVPKLLDAKKLCSIESLWLDLRWKFVQMYY